MSTNNMDFLAKVKELYKEEDYLAIEYAFHFAQNAHDGQKRASGEDYMIHPIEVAKILMDLGLDADTIIAALLHDVIEDTEYGEEDIKSKFGIGIYEMVVGVTKLTRISVANSNTQTDIELAQAETIRKLFFAMAKDIRVLLVKLADRLHNMRTLDYLPAEKQLRKSRETLDIYAPLAGRLGISWIKCELEDLSMKYLYPKEYKYLSEKLDSQRINRMQLVTRVADALSGHLDDLKFKYEIKGRPKHFYSIFKKMKNQGKTLDEIYDLVAIRVIVESVSDCYSVLGLIHSMWKPVPGRFKDYIASPKPNMYQSLHTTIVTDFGQVFEIQIRTVEMNRIAEYGIAAHWKYKEGISTQSMSELDKKLGWIKEVMDVQGDLKDSMEFLDTLKMNVSSNEIYIFTPKGAVVDLPTGSTAIDFAYRIHSEVGNRCIGIKINGHMRPVSTVLENGDIVEVLTSNAAKGPSRDWLTFVITPTAKAKIRSYFKKAMKADNIKLGKDMLEEEAKRRGFALSDLLVDATINNILEKYNLDSLDELYASIGCGGLKAQAIIFRLKEFYRPSLPKEPGTEQKNVKQIKTSNDVIIQGSDDFVLTMAGCCNPIPGDQIIGYITRGRGVTIHRCVCNNLTTLEGGRLLPADWTQKIERKYLADIVVITDTHYALQKILNVLNKLKINVAAIQSNTDKKNGTAEINMKIEVQNADDLEKIKVRLEGIKNVISIHRMGEKI